MAAALDQARSHGQVRLVQSPSHLGSFALYTKCGFTLREPLFLMQGKPLGREEVQDGEVPRIVDETDVSACNELCRSAHGFAREGELRQAKDRGSALLVERGDIAGTVLFGHAVAKSNEDLKALIASATAIRGPGFFVPARNHELTSGLLGNNFRIASPANLMSFGPYHEPSCSFIPPIAC